jgi:hypothetical protein
MSCGARVTHLVLLWLLAAEIKGKVRRARGEDGGL